MSMVDPDLAAVVHIVHDARALVDVGHWERRLRVDPTFALEMRLCKEWGIPHSTFLGWSHLDREKAMGYTLYEAQRCGDCGTHPLDWPEETDEPPLRVEAERCFACQALGEWEDAYRENHTHGGQVDQNAMRGVRTRFVPVELEE
jgi:hypothetical protein